MKENRSFYSDASHNYMVLACPPGIRDDYQYKMIAANEIRGLLPCSSRHIDNQEYLYYDITSRQSLSDLYDRRAVRGEDLQRLLGELVQVGNSLTEYLLDSSHVVLDPSCIYVDYREQTCSFAYYPGEIQEEGWETLFSFLADRVDGRDKRAAAAAYRLCMMAEKPGFRLREEVLEELGLSVPGAKGGGKEPRLPFENSAAGIGVLPEAHRASGAGQAASCGCPEEGWIPETGAQGWKMEDRFGEAAGSAVGSPGQGKDPGWTQERNPDRARGRKAKNSFGDGGGSDVCGGKKAEEKGAGRFVPAAVILLIGIGLFLLDLVYRLEETEALLAKALGGVLAAAGLGLLLWEIFRPAGRKRTEERGSGLQGDRDEDDIPVWLREEPFLPSSLKAPDSQERFPFREGGAVRTHGAEASAMNAAPAPGDTSLLGPDAGRPTGLYGTGSCRGEQISLARLPCVVGKMRDYVDQVVSDDTVSRMHARFSVDRDGEMTVRDLNSTNGTWINGERLMPNESRLIRQGDRIRLGRMEFVYR